MSTFLTGKDLEKVIYDIIWDAEKTLLIVSPYIKLDDYFKKLFNRHENNPKLHIIVVFGKNENSVHKSLSKVDFDFFKKYLNVSIIYVPNLHAKYYGNEKKGVITSINFYDYSFINNIEFGVFSETSILDTFKKSTTDGEAWHTCIEIANNNEVVYIKRPVYENKKLLINYGRNYVKSDILHDSTEKYYGFNMMKKFKENSDIRLSDFQDELELGTNSAIRPEREIVVKGSNIGFCIRTGEQIRFNLKQPMTIDSWKTWNIYGNINFPENYCHKTGKKSNGKTSMRNPVL